MAPDDRAPDEPRATNDEPVTDEVSDEVAPDPLTPLACAELELTVEYDRHVNYALQQNAVKVVKAVRLALDAEHAGDLEAVRVVFRAEPGLAPPTEHAIARVRPGDVVEIETVDLRFSPERLVALEEREEGSLIAEVFVGDELRVRQVKPLEVLAYAEWAGIRSLPQILAAFVLPNHPDVVPLLRSVRERLEDATGAAALDGYASRDPERARRMLRAVHDAIVGLGLGYVTPPASFESEGQKIRTPDAIAAAGMGTCLDLVLLGASALEAAGLNPLVVLVEGHAVLGAWLIDDAFADSLIDVPARLRKRVDLGEIALLDVTVATSQPPVASDTAIDLGRRHLDDDAKFQYAIDVAAARSERILPLPSRSSGRSFSPSPGLRRAGELVADPPPVLAQEHEDAPTAVEPVVAEVVDLEPEAPASRLDRWKRRLLDLSLRNRLLAFRDTKTTLPLLAPDIGALEDHFASGRVFTVHAEPRTMGEDDPRDPALHEARTGEDARAAWLSEALGRGRLHTSLKEEELEKRLVEIFRRARLSMEEGGANTLHLALGFLRWYEAPSSSVERRAPILLLPVELSRESVRDGFRLSLADDDPQVNVTLLQKLATDFGIAVAGLDELLTDESGLDVKGILDRFRAAVVDVDRWEVEDTAQVAIVSFSKHLMWLDLDRRSEQLEGNPVVQQLLAPAGAAFLQPDGVTFPDPSELDALDPAETFCPLDADSSQLAAIHAAAGGATFVLEGPPGTGKSQTITNLISHAIATGRRVLFVSQKRAALEVVHHRLEQVGLGEFCLELHSNKAQKRKVLEQLEAPLRLAEVPGVSDWGERARRLSETRAALNAYAKLMHRPGPFGPSPFQALAQLVALRGVPHLRLDLGPVDRFDVAAHDRLVGAARGMQVALRATGTPGASAWAAVGLSAWLPSLGRDVERDATALIEAADRFDAATGALVEAIGFTDEPMSRARIEDLGTVGSLLEESLAPPAELLATPGWPALAARLRECVTVGHERNTSAAILENTYDVDDLLGLDLDTLRAKLRRAVATFWPLSWLRARGPRAQLEPFCRGVVPPNEEVLQQLDRALEVRDLDRRLDAAATGAAVLGPHWNGVRSDWDEVSAVVDWTDRMRAVLARVAGDDFDLRSRLRRRWGEIAAEGGDLIAPGTRIGRRLEAFRAARDAFDAARAAFVERLVLDETLAWGGPDRPGHIDSVRDKARAIHGALEGLQDWCAWRRARDAGVEAGLAPLVAALEEGRVEPEATESVAVRSVLEWWVESLFRDEPLLRDFSGMAHHERVDSFRRLDRDLTHVTRDLVRARLAAHVPRGALELSGSSTSELAILERETRKRRRHRPIRQLFQRIPNLLGRLKPCLLMSPLSVAQYLDPTFPPFDLVVFDEASQIPVWDAVGAIARGRASVVVGDSKQLPPTNFFQRMEDGGEDDPSFDEDDVEELESILEECAVRLRPVRRLQWHYRSRHEELIAFSNHHYYGGELLTFPAAQLESDRLGVTWRPVPDGTYDRGGTRANRREAEDVVAEIMTRLHDPDATGSIGVVTFSVAQQTLIEDLLDAARRKAPEVERFFGTGVDEPVFVKNLENVQGDERDVILFSVGYGPDERGRVAMNFGPLNREGGERRLNVAITRARRQVLVFSTLTADQIDLARTSAFGVKHLKSFLRYAQLGPEALGRTETIDPGALPESPLEVAVHDGIEARGWEVVPQVGCSGYRIDLGVKDPANPGRFLLGVECDGAMYHSAKTARDRDRLRAAVLEQLGWTLHRIWSTDWWQSPERELDRLDAALKAARDAAAIEAPLGPLVEETPTPEPEPKPEPAPAPEPEPEPAGPVAGAQLYEIAPAPRKPKDADAFYDDQQLAKARAHVESILAIEAPIALDLLARRVADAWLIGRRTSRFFERLESLIPPETIRREAGQGAVFLWRPEQDPTDRTTFRVPDGDENPRDVEDVPPEEVAAAARAVLRDQVSLTHVDLSRETARLLGFARLGSTVSVRMEEGIALLESDPAVTVSEDRLTFNVAPPASA